MALAARPLTKTVGAAPAPKASAKELVNTAELVRGRVYWYKNQEFKKGEAVVVDDELANILEELHAEVQDKDGETYEKPFFDVRKGVPRPEPKTSAKKPSVRRLSARA